MDILEFAEDLEYYWNDGYGFDLTHRIACPAMQNMFKHIEWVFEINARLQLDTNSNWVSSPQSPLPNSTFYFTHSGTLLKLLAHLGLYKDPSALTYQDFGKPRKWRTSEIDAFATNVAFVLYEWVSCIYESIKYELICIPLSPCRCDNDEPQVLTMHQERIVHLPGCPQDSDLCSLNTLRQLYAAASLDNCNFDEMCFK